MSRRAFACAVVALGTFLCLFSLASVVDAQQAAPPRHIGVLLVNVSPESKEAKGFREGLRDAGHADGSEYPRVSFQNGGGVQPPQPPRLSVEMPLDVLHLDRPAL